MTTIDRGDSHYEYADDWATACRHIGWFLLWAAQRGLATVDHQSRVAEIAAAPGDYVRGVCDGKLLARDLTADGAAFASRSYDAYLRYLDACGRGQGKDPYGLTDSAALRDEIFGFLDATHTSASPAGGR